MSMNRDKPSSSISEEYGPFDDDPQDWYLVLCLGGMQTTIKAEVERHLAASGQAAEVHVFEEDCRGASVLFEGVHDGQAGCGKLLVRTNASPETLRDLRCVQGLFALVAHATSLDIGLPTTTPETEEGCPRNAAPTSTTSDSQPRASEAAPAKDPDPSEAALARLESLVTAAPLWPAAVNVWKRFSATQTQSVTAAATGAREGSTLETRENLALDRPGEKRTEDGDGDRDEGVSQAVGVVDVTRLKFRASVVRDGKHPFGSVEASPRLGGAVWSVNRGWTVDLKEYDVEVVTFILERSVIVGLALDGDRTKRCSHGRIPKEDKGFIDTGQRMSSLRPSTAYLMLCLAEPTVGDVVVDCMCGVGTIPFLGAGWFPGVFLVGGEIDGEAIEHLRGNAQSTRRSSDGRAGAVRAAGACAWDARYLPFRSNSVDAMVVDMPFGRTCGTPRQNAKLYPVVMAEMARVLRPGSGRAVLLVAQPHLLGIPGLQRDNRKDRKKLRKKEQARVGHHGGEAEEKITSEGHGRIEQGRRGKAIPPQAASSHGSAASGSGTSATANQGQRGTGGGKKKLENSREFSREKVFDVEPRKDERSVAAKAEAWRIRGRHAVNVGGLISYLLVLDRTNEPSPLRRPDRRKHVVGMTSLCKRRNENQHEGSSGSL